MQIKFTKTMLFLAFCVFSTGFTASAQEDMLRRIRTQMREYDFEKARELCTNAAGDSTAMASDSTYAAQVMLALSQAQNAESMSRFCSFPKVIASKRVALEDFCLYYPVQDGSWARSPLKIEGLLGDICFFPEGSGEVWFGGEGGIFQSERDGSAWTAPKKVDFGTEDGMAMLCPVISQDGLTLWFTSEGLWGMGGHDLYVCRRANRNAPWGTPENLGFPYSSPYDDFLFMDTPDGKYSVFASDRECPGSGDVIIYVLEHDSLPIHRPLTSAKQLKALCSLPVTRTADKEDETENVTDPVLREYAAAYREYAAAKIALDREKTALNALRAGFRQDSGSSADKIADAERTFMEHSRSLGNLASKVSKAEQAVHMAGKTVDPSDLTRTGKEVSSEVPAPKISRHSPAGNPGFNFKERHEAMDYAFAVLPQGRFAQDIDFPEGLIYQIQIFSKSSGDASVKDLKGLSPVFRRTENGKTTYSAGLFMTYAQATSALAKAKKAGFKSAIVTAYRDGEKIPVQTARNTEKSYVSVYIAELPAPDGRLDDRTMAAVHAHATKDMTRENGEDGVVFVIGPYSDAAEALTLISALRSEGIEDVLLKRVQ